MQLTLGPTRLTGFAILAVAAVTALSIGACSSSKSPEASKPASAPDQDTLSGLITSVSGKVVEVSLPTGKATIDVDPSAKVIEYTVAELSDITAGNCVSIVTTPAPAPGGDVTAKTVQVSPQEGGSACAQPRNEQPLNVVGTVASVTGNTINVTVAEAPGNPPETHVMVADTTQYTKRAPVTSLAITEGKCINAWGTKDGEGALQATVIGLGPASAGKCA